MKENILSVIIPAYNEELMLSKAYKKIYEILTGAGINHEFIFIDDGSADGTWREIEKLSEENVRGIKFSRNWGKEAAIYAGLTMAADSGCCVVIDCDLQHPPERIVDMYRLWQNGYEIVEGVKSSRGEESFLNAFGAKVFYDIMSRTIGIDMRKASDFKLLDRKAVLTLLNLKEKNAFFRALSSWIGFKTTQIEFDVQSREEGESKWSLKSLAGYALNNITSFSAMPMQVITVFGIMMLLASAVLGINSIVQKITGTAAEGFTTVILLQLFTGSIIMIGMGIIGYYIEKIYDEVRNRPRFVISQTCGGKQ